MLFKKKIVGTGGTGRFAQSLKKIKSKYKFIYPKRKSLDISKVKSIKNFLKNKNLNLFYILRVYLGLCPYTIKI